MTHHLQPAEYIISQLNGTNCLRQPSSLQNHADLDDLMPWDECSDLIGQTTHTDLNLVEFDAHEMQGLFDPMVLKYENDVTVTSERDTAAPDSQTHVSTTAPSPYPDFNQQMSPVSMQSYASSSPTVPSSTPYSGDYGFAVSVQKQQKETKSATWTHSEKLGKLYVRLGVACPFVYRCGCSPPTASKSGSCGRTTPAASSSGSAVGVHPPSGAIVRILPVYIRPEHVRDVVRRCPNHAAQAVNRASGDPQAISEAQHLIRSQTPKAVYVEDPCSRRLSVVIPYEQPQAGSEWVTTLLEFHCFSSCVGGLNRRPVQLIFTLEMPDGTVLGREAIEVRVCACPGRDRAGDERATLGPVPSDSFGGSSAIEKLTFDGPDSGKNSGGRHGGATKRKLLQTAATVLHSGEHDVKRPRDEQDGEMFTLNVRGRKSYDILCTIRDCLELSAMLPSHLAEQYRSKHSQLSQSQMSYDSSPLSLVATPNGKATNLKVPVALSGVATSQTAARRPPAPIGLAGVTGLSSNAIFGLAADVQLTNGSPLFYR